MNRWLAVFSMAVLLQGCGGGGGGGGSAGTGSVSFNLADAPVDTADHVVITVDKVILRRDGADDVVVDRFTIPALNLTDADTFQIDLLDYRDGKRLLVIDGLTVPAGTYSQLILHVLDNDVNYSYVDNGGVRTPIKQPSGDLKLGGFKVDADGVYAYTLDFDLRFAMTYNPIPSGGRYILKPRGVRLVSETQASHLGGTVAPALFDTDPQCATKADPTVGNVVYLYQGHALDTTKLVDVYDPDIATGVPAGAVAPFAAANVRQTLGGDWQYNFGYLPAGDYTLAFSCDAEGDQAETYDGTVIPLPADQHVEVSLTGGQDATCNLPVTGGACAP